MDAVIEAAPHAIALPPTGLIEVLDTHSRIHSRHRLAAPGEHCLIGRSVGCDIVLDDPYAAAEHTKLTLLEDGRIEVTDLGSRNGTRVDGELLPASGSASITDGELIIGRTRVRIRTALTMLTPERVFRRDTLQRHRTTLAILGAALCVGFVAFYQWIAFPDPLAPRLLTAVFTALATLAVWTGFWGIITRFTHGHWTLRVHFAIAANVVALALWSDWLSDAFVFASGWNWPYLVNAVIVGAAVLSALYLHLRKATHLTIRTSIITAVAVPLLLGGATVWINQQGQAGDVNRVSYGPNVYPPQLRVATSSELSDYLGEVEKLKREANRKRRLSLAERPLAPSE